ncbi:MAG: hypothetical protein KDA78_14720, partial [Planctomycetaceae bacterium]|nr:hypothetical protein [Planctomycetaceae bacterium]
MRKAWCVNIVCLVMLLGAPLMAAEGPELIPDSAAAVAKLMAPQKTLKSLAGFVDSVQEGYGPIIQGQAGMLGIGISNPTLQGVDQSKDWWIAVFLKKDADPAIVFVIPATDTKDMEEALDDSFIFIAHEKYGIYSDNEEAMEEIQAHLDNPRPSSVADIASEGVAANFADTHLSVAFNLELLKDIYADDIADMITLVEDQIAESQEQMLEVPGVNLTFMQDLMDTVSEKILIGLEEAESYTVSMTVNESDIELQEYLEFADGSRSANFLSKYPPQAPVNLVKLPAEQLVYWNMGGSSSEFNEWGMKMIPSMLELSDEDKTKWDALVAETRKIDYSDLAGSFSLGNLQDGLVQTVAVGGATPSTDFRSLASRVAELMDGLEISGMRQEMTYEKAHEEVDGVEVDLMLTRQVSDQDPQLGGIQAMMNLYLYGGESIPTRIATPDDKSYIQTLGGGKECMESAIAAFKNDAAGSDEAVAKGLLPLGE